MFSITLGLLYSSKRNFGNRRWFTVVSQFFGSYIYKSAAYGHEICYGPLSLSRDLGFQWDRISIDVCVVVLIGRYLISVIDSIIATLSRVFLIVRALIFSRLVYVYFFDPILILCFKKVDDFSRFQVPISSYVQFVIVRAGADYRKYLFMWVHRILR